MGNFKITDNAIVNAIKKYREARAQAKEQTEAASIIKDGLFERQVNIFEKEGFKVELKPQTEWNDDKILRACQTVGFNPSDLKKAVWDSESIKAFIKANALNEKAFRIESKTLAPKLNVD